MNLEGWFRAVDRGHFQHEWMPVRVAERGRVATFQMSKVPAVVDAVFESISAYDQQMLCDSLGWLMPTAKLHEQRWAACEVHLMPIFGQAGLTTAVEHSARVVRAIAKAGAIGRSVGDVGKSWVLSADEDVDAVNHGWIVPKDETVTPVGDRYMWRGMPVYPCWSLPGRFVVQKGGWDPDLAKLVRQGGDAELGDAHGIHHIDYSQKAMFLHPECEVDGEVMATAELLCDPELSWLAFHHDRPLTKARQPGVSEPATTAVPSANEVSTEPGEFGANLGLEALVVAREHLERGVREDLGRNDGRVIRIYASNFDLTPPLNWCAVALSYWIDQAGLALGIAPPVEGSFGAQAVMAQFIRADLWVRRLELDESTLLPGNVPVWKRPPHTWTGHIGIVESYDPETRMMTTIEGNSGPLGDRVARMQRSIDDPRLFGVGILNSGEEKEPSSRTTLPDLPERPETCWEGCDPLVTPDDLKTMIDEGQAPLSNGYELTADDVDRWLSEVSSGFSALVDYFRRVF